MVSTDKFEKLEIANPSELREWLLLNHTQDDGVWVITFKKSVPDKYVSRWDVLDELLCFGWIDGIRRMLDEDRTMQLITPRRVEHWAKSYKDRIEPLIRDGRMHASGLKSIQIGKDSGLWDFMDDVDNLIVPDDLENALKLHHGAREFFDSINDSSKRFVLRWIKLAKTEKTRQNRIDKIALLSSRGEKLPGS